jgi:8-oxo-dGTP diphosphatase
VHEFLGTLVYETNGRSKVVHYWRMEACGDQTYELMHDIRAVDWLPLDAALERLSRSSERAFLANVGPLALLSLSRETQARAQASRKPRGRNVVAPELSPPGPARPDTTAPPLAASSHEPATNEPVMDAIMAAEPALEAMLEAESVPQTEALEATIDLAAPAPVVDAEPAPASVTGAADDRADNRRWSLARKLRDWLGLAA